MQLFNCLKNTKNCIIFKKDPNMALILTSFSTLPDNSGIHNTKHGFETRIHRHNVSWTKCQIIAKLHLVRKRVLKLILGAAVDVAHAQFDVPCLNCTHYKDSFILIVLIEHFDFFVRWILSSGGNLR